MLYILGIVLGIFIAITKGIDTSINKSLMGTTSAIEHSLFRIIFVTPVLFIAALLHWQISAASIWWLLIYGLLEAVNILAHQLAIKSLNSVHAEILSKSKSLTTYILSLILVVESVSVKGVMGIVIFTAGLLVAIDFKELDRKKFSSFKGYVFEIVSVLTRTAKPFILYKLLSEGSISNEVLAFLSMPISFVFIWIVFRPKLCFKSINIKDYVGQAVIVGLSMIASGYAILYAGAVVTSMLENLSIFVVCFISCLLSKRKTGYKVWIGATLAIIGVVLVSI